MSKITKVALILIVSGLLVCGLAYFLVGGVFSKFGSNDGRDDLVKYESKGKITSLEISEAAGEVIIQSADTDKITIEYFDNLKDPLYEVKEENGELEFFRNTKFHLVLFNFSVAEKTTKITVPKDYNGDLKVDLAAGKMVFNDISVKEMELSNASGSMELTDVKADGDIEIDSASGSVEFTNLFVKGDVSIDNAAGSVEGTIDGSKSDFSISTDVSAGSCNLEDSSEGSQKLDIDCAAGSVKIDFTK